MIIKNRQRVTLSTIVGAKPAFEIHLPQLIRCRMFKALPLVMLCRFFRIDLVMALEDLMDRTGGGKLAIVTPR
jgi:hypothetical protein